MAHFYCSAPVWGHSVVVQRGWGPLRFDPIPISRYHQFSPFQAKSLDPPVLLMLVSYAWERRPKEYSNHLTYDSIRYGKRKGKSTITNCLNICLPLTINYMPKCHIGYYVHIILYFIATVLVTEGMFTIACMEKNENMPPPPHSLFSRGRLRVCRYSQQPVMTS